MIPGIEGRITTEMVRDLNPDLLALAVAKLEPGSALRLFVEHRDGRLHWSVKVYEDDHVFMSSSHCRTLTEALEKALQAKPKPAPREWITRR
jgi:hypothetical protein